MAWTWEVMLWAFRGLGGRADNIAPKAGNPRGLVPIDPQRPVVLHAPENLIFSVGDVEFVGGRLRVKDSAKVGSAERTFFENYQESFSWGSRGRDEAMSFIAALDALPEAVRTVLTDDFGMGRLLDGGEERAEHWFLETRRIGRRARGALVPILEFVEHDPAARPFLEQDGMAVTGNFPGEVLALRGDVDSFGVFRRFGFASQERVAFSMPLTLETDTCNLAVGRSINFDARMGSFSVPAFTIEDRAVTLSSMMIGNSGYPRLSRGIFNQIMQDAGHGKADEMFDRVLYLNRMLFLGLLGALEPFQGELIDALRKMARYQLQAIAHCIGTRDL